MLNFILRGAKLATTVHLPIRSAGWQPMPMNALRDGSQGTGCEPPVTASAAAPTPLPTILTVPTAASAAKPTTDAVMLTAVLATTTTAQPPSVAKRHALTA